jgi:hypothetical protein
LRGVVVLSVFALAASAGAQASGHSTVVGAALGVASYEGFALAGYGFESFYELGFHFSGDIYRNEGRLTHLVTADITTTKSIIERDELPYTDWAIEPIYDGTNEHPVRVPSVGLPSRRYRAFNN